MGTATVPSAFGVWNAHACVVCAVPGVPRRVEQRRVRGRKTSFALALGSLSQSRSQCPSVSELPSRTRIVYPYCPRYSLSSPILRSPVNLKLNRRNSPMPCPPGPLATSSCDPTPRLGCDSNLCIGVSDGRIGTTALMHRACSVSAGSWRTGKWQCPRTCSADPFDIDAPTVALQVPTASTLLRLSAPWLARRQDARRREGEKGKVSGRTARGDASLRGLPGWEMGWGGRGNASLARAANSC